MRVVGLTGGIACGKSTVSATLQQQGLALIDCDSIAHAVTARGAWGYRRVVAAFGRYVLLPNGDINRQALGDLVFSDAAARRRLNAATHLPVAAGILRQLAWAWLCCRLVVVVDMPLLMETGAYRYTRPVLLVACSPEVQLARLMKRDGCSRAAAEARVGAQMPLSKKTALADIVISNEGSLQDLQQQVVQVAALLQRPTILSLLTNPPALLLGAVLVWAAARLLK